MAEETTEVAVAVETAAPAAAATSAPAVADTAALRDATQALEILRQAREQGELSERRFTELSGQVTTALQRIEATETRHGETATALAELRSVQTTIAQTLAALTARLERTAESERETHIESTVVEETVEGAEGDDAAAPPTAIDTTPTRKRRYVGGWR